MHAYDGMSIWKTRTGLLEWIYKRVKNNRPIFKLLGDGEEVTQKFPFVVKKVTGQFSEFKFSKTFFWNISPNTETSKAETWKTDL